MKESEPQYKKPEELKALEILLDIDGSEKYDKTLLITKAKELREAIDSLIKK